MATPNYHAPVQDMPPKGGFRPVKVPGLPVSRGPPGWVVFAGVGFLTCYGLYQVGQTNIERRETKKEQREMRVSILPFLQAEEDVRFLRNQAEYLKFEAEVMSDVPGWRGGESSFYSSRWVTPRYCREN